MIKQLQIQNYKALRDVTLQLTPLHVLIGPNDSGKTSILEAIAALCRSVDHPLSSAFTGAWKGLELVWLGQRDAHIVLTATIDEQDSALTYTLECSPVAAGREMRIANESIQSASQPSDVDLPKQGGDWSFVWRVAKHGQTVSDELKPFINRVYDSLSGVHQYRWDPRFLALPLAPDSKRRFRMDPSGFGLALCLDDILGYDRDLFIRLEQRFREIFPHIKSIKLMPEMGYKSPVDAPEQIPMLQKSDGKGLYFELKAGGELIPAQQVSDGVLLVLAYLAVLHLPEPPRVLLIEEPENGIHPKRLQDVLSILRELIGEQSRTQVVMTTHSPYVVDLFEPEEVTLCRMQDDGSVAVRRLSESQTVREQMDVFTLGEIWTAEGDEALARAAAVEGEPQE
jgi:predicted ATPase